MNRRRCCPTCGHALDEDAIGVSIDPVNNVALVNGVTVPLMPRQAAFMRCVWAAYPRAVSLKELERAVFGKQEMKDARKYLNVIAHGLRERFEGLALTVVGTKGFYAVRLGK